MSRLIPQGVALTVSQILVIRHCLVVTVALDLDLKQRRRKIQRLHQVGIQRRGDGIRLLASATTQVYPKGTNQGSQCPDTVAGARLRHEGHLTLVIVGVAQ